MIALTEIPGSNCLFGHYRMCVFVGGPWGGGLFEGVRYERADRAIRCMEGVFRPWIESWNAGYLLFHPTGVATIYGFQHVDGEGRPVYRVLGAEEWIEVQRETYRFVHGVEPEW